MHLLNPISPLDPSFVHIAPSIHFRRAMCGAADSDSECTMNLQNPDLILLFTWTGAKAHHIAKYTSGYAKLFPSSPIMVITTSLNDLVRRSSTKKQHSLIPAILTILSSHLDSNFLVHCFSEGGAHKAVQFAKAFLKSTGRRIPISALCLDSARGTLNDARTGPKSQTLTSLLAYTLAPSCWTTYPIICDVSTNDSKKHVFMLDKTRRALNDPGLWDVNAPRCYLFSHTDKLTQPGSVVEHARSAEKLGARVFMTPFEHPAAHDGACHVETTAGNPETYYWATVQRTWDASISTPTFKSQAEIEKRLDIHVELHELPSERSPVGPAPEPVLSASGSVYSADKADKEAAAAAAAAPGSLYKGPASFCIKKEKSKWYDCLRPVPGYQGWGGMGVDTESFSFDFLTETRGSGRDLYRYFYAGL